MDFPGDSETQALEQTVLRLLSANYSLIPGARNLHSILERMLLEETAVARDGLRQLGSREVSVCQPSGAADRALQLKKRAEPKIIAV